MKRNIFLLQRTSRGVFIMLGLFIFFSFVHTVSAVDETAVEEIITNEYIGSGVAQNWYGDDDEWNYTLPFTFNFYGVDYTDIKIGSNGVICLDDTEDCDWYPDPDFTDTYGGPTIAPMGIDLMTDENPTNDIYITENANHVIIRWNAVEYGEVDNINFEAVLYSNGNVKFNYGDQDVPPLTYGAVVGISKGDGTTYTESIYHNTDTFHQVDTSAWGEFGPEITSTTPTDDSYDNATDQELAITFDRNVYVDTGNLTIKKVSDDSILETIDITSAQVTGWGTDTLTINPSNALIGGSRMYVNIDGGAIKDVDDTNFGGFSDAETWSFATEFEIIEEVPTSECYEVGSAEATQPVNTTLAYSDDDKTSWTYTPSDQGNGGDCSVTHIRLTVTESSSSVGEDVDVEFVGTNNQTEVQSDSVQLESTGTNRSYSYSLNSATDYATAYGVDTDSSGNIFTTGFFEDTVNFNDVGGTDERTAASNMEEAFITKYNADGSYGWTRVLGESQGEATGESIAYDVATDGGGNVYVTGAYSGDIDFDDTAGIDEHTGDADIFITKYNADGSYGWTRVMDSGSALKNSGQGIAVDGNNVYVTGYFSDFDVDFDGTSGGTDIFNSVTGSDLFLTKYNTDGSYVWTRAFGAGDTWDENRDVVVDSFGNIYIGGYFINSGDFDGTAGVDNHSTVSGGRNAFITKYAADGSYGWTQTFGGSGDVYGADITVDDFDNPYLVGYFRGNADFDATAGTDSYSSTVSNRYHIFITRYNADSSYGWTRTIGGVDGDYAYGVDFDTSDDSLYVTGTYAKGVANIDFDATAGVDLRVPMSDYEDIYITKYYTDGSYGWTRNFGGQYWNTGRDIAVNGSGRVHVAGYFTTPLSNPANFDGAGGSDLHPGNSTSSWDIALATYNTDGSYPYIGSKHYTSGTYQTSANPSNFLTWDELTISQTIPANATAEYTVLDSACTSTLLGPTTSTTIDISSISIDADDICVQASLATTNDTATPALNSWSTTYTQESTVTSFDFDTIPQGASTPPTVTTAPTTSILDRTAQGSGNITDTGGEDPTRHIEWGTVSGTYTDSCSAGTAGTGVYSCQMTNLQPNTLYYARAYATNSGGTTEGSETSFTTLPLQDIIIPDPDPTQIETRINDGYMSVTEGTLNAASAVGTNVNVTYRTANADAIFPTGTSTTNNGVGTVDFANFTIQNITNTVRAEYPDSRVAFRLGIPGEDLNFSQNITVVTTIGNPYNGQEIEILSQKEGVAMPWVEHGTCTVENGECTFTTNHATIYTVNGEHSVTGAAPMDINTEVLDTLSLDCYDTLGTSGDHTVSLTDTNTGTGLVIAGIPSVGQSTCDVTTNDDQGYFLTIDRSTEDVTWNGTNGTGQHIATNTLIHEDPNIDGTWYEINDEENDLSEYSGSNSTTWTEGTTKGLGFSVITFPDTNITNNTLDDDWELTGAQCLDGTNTGTDTAKYAAVPTDPVPIAAVTQYEENETSTTVCYKVDVLPSQQSGQYAGQVTYTATSDASGYHTN